MKFTDDHKENLRNGIERIAIWGVGYIGFSNMLYYGKEGIRTVGIDINPNIKEDLLKKDKLKNFEYWVGFDYEYLFDRAILDVTCEYDKVNFDDITAHLICVPTEMDEKPYLDALYDVVDKICRMEDSVKEKDYLAILVESTMTPGTAKKIEQYILDKKLSKQLIFGVAPRRDWFLSSDKNLKYLNRVFGGNSKESTNFWRSVLSNVCDNLIEASDYQHAEITKSIENAFRHLDITLANQLSSAFPQLDMREVLHLVGTKWNVNEYFPSFGTGGYCIPLSSKYLLQTENADVLTLLRDTVEFDEERPIEICKILEKHNVKTVGVLGLSYKEDIKVVKHSAIVPMCKYLREHQVTVYANDPYFTEDEIKDRYQVEYFNCYDMDVYDKFDAIIMFTAHKEYKVINFKDLVQHMTNCKIVLDNTGEWKARSNELPSFVNYSLVGSKSWNC